VRLPVDVAIFFLAELLFADFGSEPTMQLGRSGRSLMSRALGQSAAVVDLTTSALQRLSVCLVPARGEPRRELVEQSIC